MNFNSFLLHKMDQNKYRNIYNAMNDNYSQNSRNPHPVSNSRKTGLKEFN